MAPRDKLPDLSEAATHARNSRESRGVLYPDGPVATPTEESQAPPDPAPAPQDPAPQDPAPQDPAPTDPAPTDPEPQDPAPAASEPPRRTRRHAAPKRVAESSEVRQARLRRKHKRDRRSQALRTGRVAAIVLSIVCLVGTGSAWGYLKHADDSFIQIDAGANDLSGVRNSEAQYGDENYLIVGTDTRAGSNGQLGAGTVADAEGARSDTVILVNVPANRQRVVAVSFPRDLDVDRPECDTWDNATGTYDANSVNPAETGAKLNSVYAVGGPKCLVSVIKNMSGLNINHFIGMDFSGFIKLVNKIGGVQVCSTTKLTDDELGPILRKAGTQRISGDQALNYVRARSIPSEGNGDYGRIKRQQLFLSSLLRSMLTRQVLLDPGKLNGLVQTFTQNSFVQNVDTQSLLNLGNSLKGVDAGKVTFLTIPTSGTKQDGSNNEIPRTQDIAAIFTAIIDDTPLPGERGAQTQPPTPSSTSASTPSSTATSAASTSSSTGETATTPEPDDGILIAQDPSAVAVKVLNGDRVKRPARELVDTLNNAGFDTVGYGDATRPSTRTVVRYSAGYEDSAATIAAMIPGAVLQLDHKSHTEVDLILGSDYDGTTVNAAPEVGSTLTNSSIAPVDPSDTLPNDLTVTNAGDTTCE